jgi:hypothetical protein
MAFKTVHSDSSGSDIAGYKGSGLEILGSEISDSQSGAFGAHGGEPTPEIRGSHGTGEENRSPFARSPYPILGEALGAELAHWDPQNWSSQYTGGLGNTQAVVLVSVGGTPNDDFAITGPLQATPALLQSPACQALLRALGVPLGRCRLVRLLPGQSTPIQADQNYHWFRYQALHIPLVTHDRALWHCGEAVQHFAPGWVWRFDADSPYHWVNGGEDPCIHLVVEVPKTALRTLFPPGSSGIHSQEPGELGFGLPPVPQDGSPGLGQDLGQDRGQDFSQDLHPAFPQASSPDLHPDCPPDPGSAPDPLPLESYGFRVLEPAEVATLVQDLRQRLTLALPQPEGEDCQRLQRITAHLEEFAQGWERAFSQFGHDRRGELAYQFLLLTLKNQVLGSVNQILGVGDRGRSALGILISQLTIANRPVLRKLDKRLLAKRSAQPQPLPPPEAVPQFDRPVFIVSAPRAGSTLLYETLSQFPDLWSIGEESHDVIEGIPALHPAAQDYRSNRLTAEDATPAVATLLRQRFTQQLQDRQGYSYGTLAVPPASIRFLEKTPKNALRIPFLRSVFPDARFIFLYREAKENISSLMEGWRSRRFISYATVPGWPHGEWSFFLPPDWPNLRHASIAEIATRQWAVANDQILTDLQAGDPGSWCCIPCAELVRNPRQTLMHISQFADLNWDQHLDQQVADTLPVSKMTLSAPSPDKWRKQGADILELLPTIQSVIDRLEIAYEATHA